MIPNNNIPMIILKIEEKENIDKSNRDTSNNNACLFSFLLALKSCIACQYYNYDDFLHKLFY